MPYSNVPANLTGPMDDCVRKVQAQGHSKESAIKICYASLVGKDMTHQQRIARREDKRQHAAARRLADLQHKAELTTAAVADLAAELDQAEPDDKAAYPWDQCIADQMKKYGDMDKAKKICGAIRAGKSLTEAEADYEEKCGDMPMAPYRPYGGATSLADAMAAMDAQEQAEAINRATWMFQDVTNNILNDESLADKGKAIAAAGKELQALLNNPEPLMKAAESEPEPAAAVVEPKAAVISADMSPASETKESLWAKFRKFISGDYRAEPETKIGARHSAGDQSNVQNIHDASVSLGASCGMKVLKQADGAYRWFGWVTNKWRDRDTAKHPGGEIITEAAHKEFIGYLDANPARAPELWSWHTPGTARAARADWWDYADGFVVMSGPLTEAEAKQFTLGEALGMSHGFYALARKAEQGLIEKYRTFEVTELAPDWAANPFTDFELIRKELAAMPFTPEKRAHLVKRLGEARVAELESDTAGAAKALEALGVEWKEVEDKQGDAMDACMKKHMDMGMTKEAAHKECLKAENGGKALETPAPLPELPEHVLTQVKTLLNVDGLNQVITELQATNKTLADRLAAQDKALADLKKSDDQKIADTIAPKARPILWGHQASASDKSLLTDEEKAKLAGGPRGENKSAHWVDEAFGGLAR